MGTITAPKIEIFTKLLLSHFGTIQSSKELNISGDRDGHSHGRIDREVGEVYVTHE
jgi:hypothetical protein